MAAEQVGGGLDAKPEDKAKATELAQRLEHYRASYYAGTPDISDAAYDALEDSLRRIAPAHPVLARVGSSAVADAWEKAGHEIPMGSLNKVTDVQQLDDWLSRCDELLAKQGQGSIADALFVAEKLDGISIELIYVDGQFQDAITRGDGDVGERITANVRRMRGLPLRIEHTGRLSVRGEIILRLSDMKRHFADYASPRNAAAGTARRLDGQGNQHLTVLCYDLAEERAAASEVDKFARLAAWGFATPNAYTGDRAAVLDCYQSYASARRASLDYEIDGLVVRANRTEKQLLLGELNRRPRAAVAFKFESPKKVSIVQAIRWDTGPSGRVTPVAFIDPVVLAGATVRRASLHNATNVKRLGIGAGDEVLVSRRNDVIPYVEEVIQHAGAAEQPPNTCSSCDQAVAFEGEYLMCRNGSCSALVEGRIHSWIRAIGALEWGDKLVATLVAEGLVVEPLDLYRLGVQDIAQLDRHGEKSAKNALEQLHSRSPLRLAVFLAALGIEGFSTQTARLVVSAGYDAIDALMEAEVDALAAIDGLGEIKARNIVQGLAERAEEIARLRQAGVGPIAGELAGPLSGQSFCITGSHSKPRKLLVQRIEDAGGRVVSGVSKELNYLLIADPDSTSSKAVKARRYGTVIIDENELEQMFESGEA